METDDVSYELIGNDVQIVKIELDPGETVIAEAGGEMLCRKDAFLAVAYGTEVGICQGR